VTIYRLTDDDQKQFAHAPEIFAGVQLGLTNQKRYVLVLGCQVAIDFDGDTPENLNQFYAATWDHERPSSSIDERYRAWMNQLNTGAAIPFLTTRAELTAFVASAFPLPPNRPDLTPRPPTSLQQNVYGHLPFATKTRADEHFYRFEPWPTSNRITTGDPGSIAAGTYASPSAELRFLNTGFAAVARNALPSLFPAVFRYELQPEVGKTIYCGAIVPMHGQSGGGVEVFFPSDITNRGPIAKPVIVPPL
jgi:hypothetical protein